MEKREERRGVLPEAKGGLNIQGRKGLVITDEQIFSTSPSWETSLNKQERNPRGGEKRLGGLLVDPT